MRTISANTVVISANPFGVLTGLWTVRPVKITAPKASPVKVDFIAVIDRSGSMYHEIDNVKIGLCKLLGVHEAIGKRDITLSLISYSSHGDCQTHFSHVDMNTAANDLVVAQEIARLRSTGLTGMSQAMRLAQVLVRKGRIPYVVLMSDGYCNDPGVRSEQIGTEKATQEIVAAGGIVSTLCYGSYADFAFLNQIASTGKGVCLRAGNAAEFYRAMETGAKAAANLQAQSIRISSDGASFIACVDPENKTITSSVKDDLVLSGIPSKNAAVYRFCPGDNKGQVYTSEPDNALACLIAARVMLDNSDIARAKEYVIGSRVQDARKFWRALTSAEQRDLTAAIDAAIFSDVECKLTADLSVIPTGPSVLDLFALMEEYEPGVFQVHMPSLRGDYQRRTVGSLNGTRGPDGKVVPFRYDLVSDDEWADVTGIVINRTQPNVSIQTTMPAYLKDTETSKTITQIGPLSLANKLKTIRSYTIVGDGAVTTERARFKINTQPARKALTTLGFKPNSKTWEVEIDFSKMAVVSREPVDCLPKLDEVNHMLRAAALVKLLAAIKPKGESAEYDAGMVAELKKYGLSPLLNFSPPTCNPYEDMKQAQADGKIDVRVGYKVVLGTKEMPQMIENLYSGNEFLQRRFTAKLGDKEVFKDDINGALLLDGAKFSVKSLATTTKLNACDEVAFLVNCGALGVKEAGAADALTDALAFAYGTKAAAKKASDAIAKIRGGKVDRTTAIGEIDEIRRKIENAISKFYAERISPVVMYAGSTGSLPPSLDAKKIEVSAITGSLSKAMKAEGAFYLVRDLVVTIVATPVYVPIAKAA